MILFVGAIIIYDNLLKPSQGLVQATPKVRSKRSVSIHGWNCTDATDQVFICNNGIDCVPQDWVCNGFTNCPDGSDELNCDRGFHCNDSDRWIPDIQVCNGYSNCLDSSDETLCVCQSHEITCDSGTCISSAKYCDKTNDCGDWSDEPATCNCSTKEFTCEHYTNFSNKCLPALSVCDGVSDCINGSDESPLRCAANCQSNETRCDTGVSHIYFTPCIPTSFLCDNYIQCADGSDEANCTGCEPKCVSATLTWHGYNLVHLCNNTIDWCNEVEDCIDGSDESAARCDCSGGITCSLTGRCAQPSNAVECNGVNDCGDIRDWTDECYCGYGDYQVRYCDNTGRCLAPWQVCDGVDDCGDSSDEYNCSFLESGCQYLSPKEFSCELSGMGANRCIDVSLVCDGFGDCSNATDEIFCHEPCRTNEARCATGTSNLPGFPICIPNAMWCDGVAQCIDHSDENSVLCQESCSISSNGLLSRCQSYSNSSTYVCVAEEVCDGVSHCHNSVDELGCCSTEQFQCDNSACIQANWLCDNYDDCGDGSDERNCGNYSCYYCNLDHCIDLEKVCNGIDDCEYGLDEDETFCAIWTGNNNGDEETTTESDDQLTSFSGHVLTTPKRKEWTSITSGIIGGSVGILLIASLVALHCLKKSKNHRMKVQTRHSVGFTTSSSTTSTSHGTTNHSLFITSHKRMTRIRAFKRPLPSQELQPIADSKPSTDINPSDMQQPPQSKPLTPPISPLNSLLSAQRKQSSTFQASTHTLQTSNFLTSTHQQSSGLQTQPHPKPTTQLQPPSNSEPLKDNQKSMQSPPYNSWLDRTTYSQPPKNTQATFGVRLPYSTSNKSNDKSSESDQILPTTYIKQHSPFSPSTELKDLPLPPPPSNTALYHSRNHALPPIQHAPFSQKRLPPLKHIHRQLPAVNTVEMENVTHPLPIRR